MAPSPGTNTIKPGYLSGGDLFAPIYGSFRIDPGGAVSNFRARTVTPTLGSRARWKSGIERAYSIVFITL